MAGHVVVQGAQLLPVGEVGLALAAEAEDLQQKPVIARGKGIGALGEKPGQVRAGVEETGSLAMEPEGHLGLPRRDFEFVQKTDEQGIGGLVEDDKARVHGGPPVRAVGDGHGVGVPAQVVFLLEDRHLAYVLQQVRGHDPGHPAADDGHSPFDLGPVCVHADSVWPSSRLPWCRVRGGRGKKGLVAFL